MTVLNDESLCTGCGLCEQICPKGCITMKPKEGGFLYPSIDSDKCVNCNLCRNKCPINQIKMKNMPLKSYAFKDKIEKERVRSASGGAASVFAKAVLKNGGIYTAVRYDEDFNVIHDVCADIGELDSFRDSKYVQSSTSGIFEKIKSALDEGRQVVATGTPCQIAAIQNYLGQTYDNLILCDLICHGVPSPLVFKCYLKSTERAKGKTIKSFYFRDKTNGWRKSNVKIIFDDNSEQIISRRDCDFYRLFGNNMIFRKSCHSCNFREFNTSADITIGDYWGIEKKYPDFADETGCSVVIINTEKGQRFFDNIKDKAEILETETTFAIETHPKLLHSITESVFRTKFFKVLKADGSGYKKAVNTFLNNGLVSKSKRFIIKLLTRRKQND